MFWRMNNVFSRSQVVWLQLERGNQGILQNFECFPTRKNILKCTSEVCVMFRTQHIMISISEIQMYLLWKVARQGLTYMFCFKLIKNEFQQSFLPFHVYIQTLSWARTEYTAVYPLCYFFKNNFSCKSVKDHMSFISKQRKFFSRILNFSSHYYTEENLILFSPFTLKLLLNCYF